MKKEKFEPTWDAKHFVQPIGREGLQRGQAFDPVGLLPYKRKKESLHSVFKDIGHAHNYPKYRT